MHWSATMQDLVIYESRLELRRLLYAAFDPAVRGIVAHAAATEAAALRRARAERAQLRGPAATMRCARPDVVGEKESL
ncbi:hypothetical protein ACFV4T_09130 [Streptomyces sp. NPDC059755]|uniref:hypothetical protein n=1 Tax=Streptomyces sp. NPDC059755 TaxID=3346934 RepID=UPI00365864DB